MFKIEHARGFDSAYQTAARSADTEILLIP
jgi:hypothetical protein